MPPSSSSQDLSQAMAALQKSISILIVYYKGYIKCILLVIFVYVFYKLGHMSLKDDGLQKKQNLEELIQRRTTVKVEIPKRLIKLRKITFLVLISTGLLLLLEGVGYYTRIKWIKKSWGTVVSVIIFLSIISLSVIQIYKYFLNKRFRQSQSLEVRISKGLAQFQSNLGPKVNKLLKQHICRNAIQKLNQSMYSRECIKPKCKQLRSMYKSRVEMIESLVNGSVDFEWCSGCRKRRGFDELLGFEYREYVDGEGTQEEEIREKTRYLVDGLERMREWLSAAGGCNCSKLYWNMSREIILDHKRGMKCVEERIKELEEMM